jgi:CobQ-like glutamine amidotransferase family enzyme
MSGESTVGIGLLLPDVLGTYSDRGNATVLAQRLGWRGIEAEVVTVTADSEPPAGCDVYVIGGGEDGAQAFAAEWLRRHEHLRTRLQTAHVLAVCAGLQVLGHWMEGVDGRRQPGLGILDVTTSPGRRRAVGEVVAGCALPGVGTLTGFENHRGVTSLGSDTAPLAAVVKGMGNGTGDGGEGVLTSNVIGTYLHGPVLARNPALADHILQAVTGQELPPLELPDQEDVRRIHLAVADQRSPGRLRRVRAALGRPRRS